MMFLLVFFYSFILATTFCCFVVWFAKEVKSIYKLWVVELILMRRHIELRFVICWLWNLIEFLISLKIHFLVFMSLNFWKLEEFYEVFKSIFSSR